MKRMQGMLFALALLTASAAWAAPTVTGVNPPDGGTAQASTTVSATFSEAMDPATLTTGSFNLSQHSGFKTISGGYLHAIALKNDGTAVAWGNNSYNVATVPWNIVGIVDVAAGGQHNVVLKNDGTVVAWGYNSYGQCNVPAGLSGVVAIAAGGDHSVALKGDGTVVAWGNNAWGQCNVPAGLTGVVAVAAGYGHTVALKDDGTVFAWGDNNYVPPGLTGIVKVTAGSGHTAALKNDGTVVGWNGPTVPAGLTGVIDIDAGSSHVVALKNDGTVVAWGSNYYGESTVPAGLTGVVAVDAGGSYSVALKNDGTIEGWGKNNDGQLMVPAGLSGIISVAGGEVHSAALKSNGKVTAWGNNWFGQLSIPADVSNIVALAVGGRHNVALKNDGTVTAWGSNEYGQSTVPAGLTDVIAVSAGGGNGSGHSVALKDDGTVVCWGNNSWGQSTVPLGLSGIVAVGAGDRHTIALKSDGTVVAWGSNANGETTVPVGLTGVVSIAAGWYHNLAIKDDGTVTAWGKNNYGQSTVPAGLTGVVAVAGGSLHSLALKSDGTVVAWGSYYTGANVPSGLSGVVAIGAGTDHSLAVKSDGTVAGWGRNGYSQISPLSLSVLSAYETAVEGTVSYDPGNYTATFTPAEPLNQGTTYFATVNSGARNAMSEPIAADVRWSFNVAYPPLVFETTTLPDGVEFDPYSQTLTATGGDGSYFWEITAGSLPDGLGLGQTSGVISGAPTTAGTYPFTIQVTSGDEQTDTRNLTIAVYSPLAIQTVSLPDGIEYVFYSQTLSATGGNTPYIWSIASGSLPEGLNLNPDGTISGTPTNAGTYPFTVQATSADNQTATRNLSITVYPPLAIQTTTLPDGVEFDPYSQTLSATGGDGSYSWEITAGSLPDGLGLNLNSGEISGTPTNGGTYPFTVRVTSGDDQTATRDLSIVIGYPPLAIQTTSLPNGPKHMPYSETLTATGGNTPLSWVISDYGTLPSAEWSLSQDGVLSSEKPSKGTYTFTVRATSALPDTQTATQELSITIDN